MLAQLLANGLVTGCLYAIMATGFALIYNTTRIFHIALGATYTVAAYLCFLFMIRMQWPLWLAIALALLLTGLLGVLTEWVVYAPLERRGASLLVALLSSIGLSVALVNTIALAFGNETQVLLPGVDRTYRFGAVILTRVQLSEVLVAAVVLPLLYIALARTGWGKIMRAVRDNPRLTLVMGVDQYRVRLAVFGLGSALAGAAAILSALDVGMDPNVGMPMLLTASVALIVGGIGSFHGAAVGGLLLGILQSIVIWQSSARWTDAVTFAILIAFLLLRPQGLFGKRRRIEEAAT